MKLEPKVFVDKVLEKCKGDTGFAARLRRADNPDTEHYALGDLCALGVPIENEGELLPFALIAAAISRDADNMHADGTTKIGAALRQCLPDEEAENSPRLRRLLACESMKETCQILRPMLSLIRSKGIHLNHAALLHDIRCMRYGKDAWQNTKRRWVSDFYRKTSDENETAGAKEA